MVRITIRFPLGVYHAQSSRSFDEAEWPPSPLRLVGALLAAAHGRHDADPSTDRALLQRLCDASAPLIVAPESVAVGEAITADEAVRLRGATRWAPRNYFTGNKGRTPASVSKVGVAIGDRPVHFIWPDVEFSAADFDRLAALAGDVTFVGTTRSPAILAVDAEASGEVERRAWAPVATGEAATAVSVRVPDSATILAFDRREEARRSASPDVEPAGMVPGIWIGRDARYAYGPRLQAAASPIDPQWWGDMIVLAIDPERSELVPRAAAAYLVARAVRVALLGTYEDAGMGDEAPPILRGRGEEPHCAVVPLANVWSRHADGRVLGVGIVLPHFQRIEDADRQRDRVEAGLRRLTAEEPGPCRRPYVQIPDAGRIWLRTPGPREARWTTLRERRYTESARSWATVTPIVYSRWPKGGRAALVKQVMAECAHVGLPEPGSAEILRGPTRPGAATRAVDIKHVPQDWRKSVTGPMGHVRIGFPAPVHGPILLGRARHFGLGLCVPERAKSPESPAAQEHA